MLGRDEVRIGVVMREQPLLIGRELEIIALLLDPFDRRAGGRELLAFRRERQFGFIEKGFVADRIPAGIFREINIAIRRHPLPDRLRRRVMARLRGAHDVVGFCLERIAHPFELRRRAVGQVAAA